MSQILDSDYNSNSYFFLTNFSETLKAGRNSFTVNPTELIVPNQPIYVRAYDINGNTLHCGEIKPTNARFFEQTNAGKLYFVNIDKSTPNGIGKIEIRGIGIELGDYTGSIAYYNNKAYKVTSDQRLPLAYPPSNSPISSAEVLWQRKFLIDTTKKTDSDIRFFDSPYIRIRPEIYPAPQYPTASYALATGKFSTVSITPKHNGNGDYDYQFDDAIYQLFRKTGTKFNSLMDGQYIRLKNPTIAKFKYNDYNDPYQGTLYTDFVAKIKRVISEDTLLLDIPFTTVSELITLTNEDSPYAKNNFVKLKGYTVNDNPLKQTVFHKTNFYALSITDGEFEIFYNNIPIELPRADPSGTNYLISLLDIEFNNIRTLCGALGSYKIYGRSLNSPESKTLLTEGKIEPDPAIKTNKFDNALRGNPAGFYSQPFMNKHWFITGSCTLTQDSSVLIDGALISHYGNENMADYAIYKDNTGLVSQNAMYTPYNLLQNSYWYANADAFINYRAFPTASYLGISNTPSLASYESSQENLISGSIHDSNSIKLRANTLYKFAMRIKSSPNNTDSSKLHVYFVTGGDKKLIGYIDGTYNLGFEELYENTFFKDFEAFGTIMIVPVRGSWFISAINIEPHQNDDYSIDSFSVKVPIKTAMPNELYEIEAELYDVSGKLAYGRNSYTFAYNKKFMPLHSRVFINPLGISL